MKQIAQALVTKTRAWLDRTDPQAQELSGQKPKEIDDDARQVLLDDARKAGAALAGMKLRQETIDAMRRKDALAHMDEGRQT